MMNLGKRRKFTLLTLFLSGMGLGAALWLATRYTLTTRCEDWTSWRHFREAFVREGGRVVDIDTPRQHTVSEGQAYALFFALVANDRQTFEAVLQWTEDHLAQGDLTAHLPAWHWGRRDDDNWGMLDANPASDADLWIAYTLIEAGRLWDDYRVAALGGTIANRILREDVQDLPGLGPTLLPGPTGFHPTDDVWRLNPSYVPLQLVRRMAALFPDTAWAAVFESSRRLIIESADHGFAPDWVLYQRDRGFLPDPATAGAGSYDAIRVYLWAGMLPAEEPARSTVLQALAGMSRHVIQHGVPPESVDTRSGEIKGTGPAGFSAALLPFLEANGATGALTEQRQRLEANPPDADARAYYAQALASFGLGYTERRFRFVADGALVPAWDRRCVRLQRR